MHLTSILSKIVERAIGYVFLPLLNSSGAFGINQWAFRPSHSCKDLVTMKVTSWILAAHRGRKTAVYLSDISGASDRVAHELLIAKCRRAGLGDVIC